MDYRESTNTLVISHTSTGETSQGSKVSDSCMQTPNPTDNSIVNSEYTLKCETKSCYIYSKSCDNYVKHEPCEVNTPQMCVPAKHEPYKVNKPQICVPAKQELCEVNKHQIFAPSKTENSNYWLHPENKQITSQVQNNYGEQSHDTMSCITYGRTSSVSSSTQNRTYRVSVKPLPDTIPSASPRIHRLIYSKPKSDSVLKPSSSRLYKEAPIKTETDTELNQSSGYGQKYEVNIKYEPTEFDCNVRNPCDLNDDIKPASFCVIEDQGSGKPDKKSSMKAASTNQDCNHGNTWEKCGPSSHVSRASQTGEVNEFFELDANILRASKKTTQQEIFNCDTYKKSGTANDQILKRPLKAHETRLAIQEHVYPKSQQLRFPLSSKKVNASMDEFFCSKYRKKLNEMSKTSEVNGECKIWQGSVLKSGYGKISVKYPNGKWDSISPARLALMLKLNHITLPPGTRSTSLCHNKLCVNPQHLSPEPNGIGNQRKNCFVERRCTRHRGYEDCKLHLALSDSCKTTE